MFFIDGSPSFNDFCIGYPTEGTIIYNTYNKTKKTSNTSNEMFYKTLNIDQGIKATISMKFSLIGSGGFSGANCGKCNFNADIIFTLGDISIINP